MMAVNMSVWETVEHLEQFVWNTVHKRFYNRKAEWFGLMKSHHFVMWFVPTRGTFRRSTRPRSGSTISNANGNSDHAFDWSHLEHIKLWQSQRCG